MSFLQTLWPFKKKADAPQAEAADSGVPAEIQKELADSAQAKGVLSLFYRKWKDPSFLKQMRTLAAHMANDGVDLKDRKQVQAWLEKNKAAVEAGSFKELPGAGAKPETYVKAGPDVGRNDPCTCGSGKKYKKCCGLKG